MLVQLGGSYLDEQALHSSPNPLISLGLKMKYLYQIESLDRPKIYTDIPPFL